MRLAPGEVAELRPTRASLRARRGKALRTVLVIAGGLALLWLTAWIDGR